MNVDALPGPGEAAPDELAEIAAADLWLDTVAARAPLPHDSLATALAGWLDHIDAEYVPLPSPPRRARSHRTKVVALAAAGALLVTGVGTAAAETGTPLNRLIFGDPSPVHTKPVNPDVAAALWQAATLTRKAHQSIDAATLAGGISATAREAVTGQLSAAGVLLAPLPDGATRSALLAQIAALRASLAGLPALTARLGPAAPSPSSDTRTPSATRPSSSASSAASGGSSPASSAIDSHDEPYIGGSSSGEPSNHDSGDASERSSGDN